ncbi:MAG: hypothetical protein HY304_03755, partial [candidate division Zixibacteria bacterium]|nr:hypothetical protein [candidate division Zixibacteria bacterium]
IAGNDDAIKSIRLLTAAISSSILAGTGSRDKGDGAIGGNGGGPAAGETDEVAWSPAPTEVEKD